MVELKELDQHGGTLCQNGVTVVFGLGWIHGAQ
jgi:hypothetical protein